MSLWIAGGGEVYSGDCRLGDRAATPDEIAWHQARVEQATVVFAPRWKVRAVLRKRGLFAAIDAALKAVAADQPEALEAWENAESIASDSALVAQLAAGFGLTGANVRDIIAEANTIQG